MASQADITCSICGKTTTRAGKPFTAQSIQDHEYSHKSSAEIEAERAAAEKSLFDEFGGYKPGKFWIDITDETGFYVDF